jgi:LPS sulfotransferase NodH
MSLDFIDKIDKSVVVLTTPRTGSTALCRVLSDKCNLVYFNEAFNPICKDSIDFWDYFEKDCKTVVKIFPDQQVNITEDQFNSIIEKSFVIFLDRTDIVSQITSYHILGVTQKPWYTHNETREEYVVNEDNILKSLVTLIELKNKAEKYRQLLQLLLLLFTAI